MSVNCFVVFQMRKQRTLTDLLEEAEGAINDPFRPKKQQVRYDDHENGLQWRYRGMLQIS